MISHIVALACDDEAFLVPKITPRVVFTLGVHPGLDCQPIQWHEEMKDKPVFRASRSPERKLDGGSYEPLPYGRYQEWVKSLGEETGFVHVLTTYCLRRAAGNAINGKPRRGPSGKRLAD